MSVLIAFLRLSRAQLDAIELAAAGLATHLSFDAGDKIFTQGSPIEARHARRQPDAQSYPPLCGHNLPLFILQGLIVIASGEVQLATQAGGEAFLVLGRGDYAGEVMPSHAPLPSPLCASRAINTLTCT